MQYPNTNNSLFVYNKQGQINEVPIVFTDNSEYSVKASAKPMEDVIIVGLMFQNNMLTNVDNNPLFKNITNIERFLMQQSTNTSFIIPTNNYRIGGVPILFEQLVSNFDYVSKIKPVSGYPTINYFDGNEFEIMYLFPIAGSYSLQFYNGSDWITIVPDNGISNSAIFSYNFSSNFYIRVINGQDDVSEPFYLDVNAYNNN